MLPTHVFDTVYFSTFYKYIEYNIKIYTVIFTHWKKNSEGPAPAIRLPYLINCLETEASRPNIGPNHELNLQGSSASTYK